MEENLEGLEEMEPIKHSWVKLDISTTKESQTKPNTKWYTKFNVECVTFESNRTLEHWNYPRREAIIQMVT